MVGAEPPVAVVVVEVPPVAGLPPVLGGDPPVAVVVEVPPVEGLPPVA